MRNTPAIFSSVGIWSRTSPPTKPTEAPSTVNTAPKPTTNAAAWVIVSLRLAVASGGLATPVRCAIYAGTRGSTHGDKKEITPAAKANAGPTVP